MNEVLSLWRSPLDKVALSKADALRDRQPRCSITFTTDFNPITVYNFGYYGASPNPGGSASANGIALTSMFADMSAATGIGGTALIEQLSFPINVGLNVPYEVPDQSNIIGTGTGGENGSSSFFHFLINGGGAFGSLFLSYNPSSNTSGGTYFRNLAFQWSGATSGTETCIYAGGWNCRAVNCNFVNCPTAFSASGLSCGLDQCTIQYLSGPGNAVAVYLQGPQCFVLGPGEFRQATPGPKTCTAIALGGGAEGPLVHGVVSDVHIYYWYHALNYSLNPNVEQTNVRNVVAEVAGSCVYMTPPSTNNHIVGDKYTSCTFQKEGASLDPIAIVFIDTNGGGNGFINDIEFLNCTVYGDAVSPHAGQYCYQITSGSNIRIMGGTVSNAGTPTNQSAGIAITPTSVSGGPSGPGRITILGVDLSASYPRAANPNSQQWALLIAPTVTLADVISVDNCKMTGYGAAGPVSIQITAAELGTNLYIRNCEGYNDLNTPLNGGAAPTSATSAATCSTPYFGPSVVTFWGTTSTTVHVFGGSYSTTFGTIFLPSPYDTIYFSAGVPTHFAWLGK